MRGMRPTSALILSALLMLASVPALAQEAADAPAPGADEYTQRVQQGIALQVAGDSSGAQEAFRSAVGIDSARAPAVYYLAASNRMAGNLEDALAGFRQAAEKAAASDEPRWQARSLQGVASTLEQIDGRLADAYEAWQAYVQFADAHQTVAHPQLGRARMQAYNVMYEQELAFVSVRERIAQRERENAAGD